MVFRVLHVTTGLGQGGAETMLSALVRKHSELGVRSGVLALRNDGQTATRLRAAGDIPVVVMSSIKRSPETFLKSMNRLISNFGRPDVIHTWLYHADVAGLGIAKTLGIPIVWNLHVLPFQEDHKRSTRLIEYLCSRLSKVPDAVVACAQTVRDAHVAHGFSDAIHVIENGIDTNAFQPDASAKKSVLEELRLPPDSSLVVMAARYHPSKDHNTALDAFKKTLSRQPKTALLLCGHGVDERNAELVQRSRDAGIASQCRFLGIRNDMDRLFAASDICLLSSRTEALPMVLLEAMASGCPCVATDVGECANVLGETGVAVLPDNPSALAAGLVRILEENDKQPRRRAARARIQKFFSLERTADNYLALYKKLAARY